MAKEKPAAIICGTLSGRYISQRFDDLLKPSQCYSSTLCPRSFAAATNCLKGKKARLRRTLIFFFFLSSTWQWILSHRAQGSCDEALRDLDLCSEEFWSVAKSARVMEIVSRLSNIEARCRGFATALHQVHFLFLCFYLLYLPLLSPSVAVSIFLSVLGACVHSLYRWMFTLALGSAS